LRIGTSAATAPTSAACDLTARQSFAAAATGLRPEEWIPLEKADVDEHDRTATIRRTYTDDRGLEDFVGKTAKSIRTVPLSDTALVTFRRQCERHPESALLFPAPRGGHPNFKNWRRRDWRPALDAAGVASRGPNALRQTFATRFLIVSDDRWLLAQLMGTSVDMIEQHYAHFMPPHAERAREILAGMWQELGRGGRDRHLQPAPLAARPCSPAASARPRRWCSSPAIRSGLPVALVQCPAISRRGNLAPECLEHAPDLHTTIVPENPVSNRDRRWSQGRRGVTHLGGDT
jgi:hypothetical protein